MEMRIQTTDGEPFVAREWLRREVLWASLMTPYETQWQTWQNGTTKAQHAGNVSRRAAYALDKSSPESQALSFFNQGKNIGGILSSAALFKLSMSEKPRTDGVPLSSKALCIDKALTDSAVKTPAALSDVEAYETCEKLALSIDKLPAHRYQARHRLLLASKHMLSLAQIEVQNWLTGDQDSSLLTIPNGGSPRSAGLRVDLLQPVLHEVVASASYQAL